jgi:hypothetical protein
MNVSIAVHGSADSGISIQVAGKRLLKTYGSRAPVCSADDYAPDIDVVLASSSFDTPSRLQPRAEEVPCLGARMAGRRLLISLVISCYLLDFSQSHVLCPDYSPTVQSFILGQRP